MSAFGDDLFANTLVIVMCVDFRMTLGALLLHLTTSILLNICLFTSHPPCIILGK